jgi:hypothetical protein
MIVWKKVNWTTIFGYTILVFGFIWMIDNLHLLYAYKFTTALFYFMYPDWILVFNAFIGLYCMVIGIRLIKSRFTLKQGLYMTLPFLITGGLLKLIIALF